MKIGVDKIFVSHATKLSLSDRFTIMQSIRPEQPPPWRPRAAPAHAARPRRASQHLTMTPLVQAALGLKKRPVKQRIGIVTNVTRPYRRNKTQYRPSLREETNGNYETYDLTGNSPTYPTRKQMSLSRSNSLGNLSRSYSYENISQTDGQRNGNFWRGRGSRSRGVFRSQGRGQGSQRNGDQHGWWGGGNGSGGGGGGGGRNWRGRGRGQRGGLNRKSYNQKVDLPTKEQLDQQLEEYMAGSRAYLDKELDGYMSTAMDLE